MVVPRPLILAVGTATSLSLATMCAGFAPCHILSLPNTLSRSSTSQPRPPFVSLSAKKGFGKEPVEKPKKKAASPPPPSEDISATAAQGPPTDSPFLQSVEGGSYARPEVDIDPNLPVEERTKKLLQEKYGMQTFEERQDDLKTAEKRKAEKERYQKLKEMAEDEKFDIFALIPQPILILIDRFLKAGVAVSTVLFIAAGIGITAEAWSAASGSPLPENVDDFIVNVVEPNFTPGLLVLLGFSVSLGVFSAAQLGSESSQYQEKP